MSKRERINDILVSLLKACAYLLAFYLSQILLGIVLGLALSSVSSDFLTERAMELSIISNLIAVVLCILLMQFMEKKKAVEGFEMHLDIPKPLTIIALCCAIGIFGQYIVSFIINTIPLPTSLIEPLEESSNMINNSSPSIRIIALAIVAPLAEEIIFRACIQGTLSKAMGKWVAIAISALVFGIAHGNMLSIINATLLGVLMGWLYAQFKSIFPSMMFHFAYNLTSVFINRLNIIMFIISCACLVLGIGYLVYISIAHKNYKGDNDEAL